MPDQRVSRFAHQLEIFRPFTRMLGALVSNTGSPRTMVSGWAAESAMNAAIRSAGCCPSESIVNTWVKPCVDASVSPSRTAAPLPPFFGRTSTRNPGSPRAIS